MHLFLIATERWPCLKIWHVVVNEADEQVKQATNIVIRSIRGRWLATKQDKEITQPLSHSHKDPPYATSSIRGHIMAWKESMKKDLRQIS